MKTILTLDVLISTIGQEGLAKVQKMILEPIDNVRYIISCQTTDGEINLGDFEGLNNRPDISIYFIQGSGLSRNRNNCLKHSTADIALIADDDLKYTQSAFKEIVKAFQDNPNCQIGLFRYDGPDNKRYPDGKITIKKKLPRHYYVSSIEIAIKKCEATKSLDFDNDFGLGAPEFHSGEESLFIWRAIRNGITIMMFPIIICKHPELSTGLRQIDPCVLKAQGACTAIMHPFTLLPRLILSAYLMKRQGYLFFKTLKYFIIGATKISIVAKRKEYK